MVDVIKAINAGIDKREAQHWPVYGSTKMLDRTKYVSASATGYCARKIKFDNEALANSGYVPEEGTRHTSDIDWGFFERGHNVEAWAVALMHLGGTEHPVVMTGKDQRSFVDGYQSGTPDGVIMYPNGVGVLEIKSIDPRTNITRLPKPQHIDQVIQNIDLVSNNMNRSPIGGVLIYIDASNYKKQHVFQIDFHDENADRLYERAEWIMEAQSPADLPAEGLYKDDCKYCAHTAACSALIRETRKEDGNDERQAAGQRLFG